jgi:hypothetical protein
MAVFFGGRLITTPTSASVVNDDAMRNQNLSVGNRVALIGRSAGGKPKTALRFGGPEQAIAELGSGELLDAVLKSFDPSSETGGPFEVIAVRVNPAVPATLSLKDADGEAVINLTSTNFGQRENMIKAKVEAGTLEGVRITTQRGNDYYTQDNVGRAVMAVEYGGTEATATLTITGTQAILSAPAGTAVATIALVDCPQVQDLVDHINLVPDFEAEVLNGNYARPTVNALDFCDAQSVKTAFTARADLQAAVDWFNGSGEGFVTAVRAPGAGAKPAPSAFQFMTGGSDGTTTNSDWAEAFEALQGVDVQWVTPVSGEAALHAMADTHVAFMSVQGRKERRSICGTELSTSKDAAKTAAKSLNSDRTSLMFQGHYDYDATGKLVLYPAYMSAARVAGAFSGVNPGTPLTNKNFKCRGLEFNLRNPTDTDEMINAGLLCLEDTEEGYKIVRSISTWLVNNNYNRVEQSTGVALDFTVRNVRDAEQVLVGTKGHIINLNRSVSIAESTLRELARAEPEGPGVLAGDAEHPAYRNIRATQEGDAIRLQFECSPVIPNNYVLTTVYAVPYSGSATV